MSLYIPKMSDTPGVTIPGLASNFNALADSRIVEHGSNENGQYWRWENGLQICTQSFGLSTTISSEFVRHDITTYVQELQWIFPAIFIESPACLVSGIQLYTMAFSIHVVNQSPPNNVLIQFVSTTSPTSYAVRDRKALAVGRWKQ